MVAWPGYNDIVYFAEVAVGRMFASSKSGRVFIKTGRETWTVDELDCRLSESYPEETFQPKDLVYTGPLYDGVLY